MNARNNDEAERLDGYSIKSDADGNNARQIAMIFTRVVYFLLWTNQQPGTTTTDFYDVIDFRVFWINVEICRFWCNICASVSSDTRLQMDELSSIYFSIILNCSTYVLTIFLQ